MNEHVVDAPIQESQREPVDELPLPAVARLVVDVVRREEQLLAEEFEISVQQGPLDVRELAKPQDVEEPGVGAGRECQEAAVVAQHTPDLRHRSGGVLVSDQVVKLHPPGSGAVKIGELVAADARNVNASRWQLAKQPPRVMRVLAAGQQRDFHTKACFTQSSRLPPLKRTARMPATAAAFMSFSASPIMTDRSGSNPQSERARSMRPGAGLRQWHTRR